MRGHVQPFIQRLLVEEVTMRLGRAKAERLVAVDAPEGYRNGYGKPRKLTLTCGTITVQRPRVRNLTEHFVSRLLPLFQRRTKQVGELLPQLYLHGLALGDFELALRGLLGESLFIVFQWICSMSDDPLTSRRALRHAFSLSQRYQPQTICHHCAHS